MEQAFRCQYHFGVFSGSCEYPFASCCSTGSESADRDPGNSGHLPDSAIQYPVCITCDRGTLPLPSSEADTRMPGRTDDAFLSSGALDRSFGYVLQECLFRSGKRCLHADRKELWPVAWCFVFVDLCLLFPVPDRIGIQFDQEKRCIPQDHSYAVYSGRYIDADLLYRKDHFK